jgi:hypothetical protein
MPHILCMRGGAKRVCEPIAPKLRAGTEQSLAMWAEVVL